MPRVYNWVRILCLGDSLTFGSRDHTGLCWPFYLAHQALRENIVLFPEVEAFPGITSCGLLRKADPIIQSSEAKEGFLLIGTNDAKEEHATPGPLYLANVHLLVAWLRVRGIREYVLTLPETCGFGDPMTTKRALPSIRAYNEALREQGFPRLVECANVHSSVDGVHLTVESATEIAERVWTAVKKERELI